MPDRQERSITIATPFYNEAQSAPSYFERIDPVCGRLGAQGWKVDLLLIDDGSSDSTASLIENSLKSRPFAQLVRHPRNLGYGAAIKTALAVSRSEWIAFVDADSNYDQRLVLDLAEHIAPGIDMINVSILAPGGQKGFPWYRVLLSSSVSALYRMCFPRLTRGIYTMTCGFRVYHRALVERIFPREDGFVATSEIMLRALIAGARVLEFPATNTKREHGVSKMRFLQTVLRHMKLIARVLLSRLGPPMPVNAHLERIQWNE